MKKNRLPAVLALLALFILYILCTGGNELLAHLRDSDPAPVTGPAAAGQKEPADPADRTSSLSIDSEIPDSSLKASGSAGTYSKASDLPDPADISFSGKPYMRLHGDVPLFTEEDRTDADACIRESSGTVSPGGWMQARPLDRLGRCQGVTAIVGPETIPSEDRESIREVEPSGWRQAEYDFIEGGYLYNRCHLAGFQLCGVSADERNLVTGTQYLNITGMQPWEDWVAEYVCRTGEHVLYRVTPVFEGENLVASGIQIEAEGMENSVFHFCVYCFNVQPGIRIDYRTGRSEAEGIRGAEDDVIWDDAASETGIMTAYILNTNSGKFHRPECEAAGKIAWRNRIVWERSREELIELGYAPCGMCRP